jgi:hypothetical protein
MQYNEYLIKKNKDIGNENKIKIEQLKNIASTPAIFLS